MPTVGARRRPHAKPSEPGKRTGQGRSRPKGGRASARALTGSIPGSFNASKRRLLSGVGAADNPGAVQYRHWLGIRLGPMFADEGSAASSSSGSAVFHGSGRRIITPLAGRRLYEPALWTNDFRLGRQGCSGIRIGTGGAGHWIGSSARRYRMVASLCGRGWCVGNISAGSVVIWWRGWIGRALSVSADPVGREC
jgi:hypothetical protein